MNEEAAERTAKWMVGGRLSCVLHIGDSSLAYRLADQGHDVVVLDDEISTVRHPGIAYVRSRGERLPFAPCVFDTVVVPHFDDSPLAMSEYARVLRDDGLLSTLSQRHDDSIPWLKKLRDTVGIPHPPPPPTPEPALATGLFHAAESISTSAWERFDLEGVLRFGRSRRPTIDESDLARVRSLYQQYVSHNDHLQVRHEMHATRVRVDQSQIERPAEPDQVLLDLA